MNKNDEVVDAPHKNQVMNWKIGKTIQENRRGQFKTIKGQFRIKSLFKHGSRVYIIEVLCKEAYLATNPKNNLDTPIAILIRWCHTKQKLLQCL